MLLFSPSFKKSFFKHAIKERFDNLESLTTRGNKGDISGRDFYKECFFKAFVEFPSQKTNTWLVIMNAWKKIKSSKLGAKGKGKPSNSQVDVNQRGL